MDSAYYRDREDLNQSQDSRLRIRDAVADIIEHELGMKVDNYRAADEIIAMLRPDLLEDDEGVVSPEVPT